MDAVAIIIIVALIVVAVAAAAWFWSKQKRSRDLRQQFGPEYEETVGRYGDKRRAESDLEHRRERVEKLQIVPLPGAQCEDFQGRWERTQARFVDDPSGAVTEADVLVREVMMARGYPVTDFEQRSADISVDYPDLVSNYRQANAIQVANARGEATTEDLRDAVIYYRALFTELLVSDDEEGPKPPTRREQRLERQRRGRSHV